MSRTVLAYLENTVRDAFLPRAPLLFMSEVLEPSRRFSWDRYIRRVLTPFALPHPRGSLQDQLNALWQGSESGIKTVVMVTHDINEAIYLSDRIVVMTNGPRAGVQEIIEVPFARPRSQVELGTNPMYTKLRERLVYLLTDVLAVKDVA